MKRFLIAGLVACSSKSEPPPAVLDLTCPAVVAHVAKLTLRPSDYARPLVEPVPPISDTDPRAFRMRRVDEAIKKPCGSADDGCARAIVLREIENECVEREWSDDRKTCLLEAKDAAAIDACGPAPAPILPAPPRTPARSLGEDCLGDADCEAAAKCVEWTTEDGERHATCEIPCGPKPDYKCPAGRGCVHQGGGPSGVCLVSK